jgi:hypothetical protein
MADREIVAQILDIAAEIEAADGSIPGLPDRLLKLADDVDLLAEGAEIASDIVDQLNPFPVLPKEICERMDDFIGRCDQRGDGRMEGKWPPLTS